MAKSKTSAPEAADTTRDSQTGQDVEQIREILFGGHMRDYEHRFAQLEQRYTEQTRKLAEEVARRFGKLEEYLQKELKSLNDALSRERNERRGDSNLAAEQAQALQREMQERVAELEEKADEEAREMRAALHNTSAELGDAILSNREQIEKSLNQEASTLHDEKVSRTDMAELLSEVALRLKREFDVPEK